MKKVFIAGPYTLGDIGVNVKNHMITFDALCNYGFAPFNPLLFHFQHIMHPRSYNDWTKIDNEYLLICDAVLRLPGKSLGADNEVKLAHTANIPVFYTIEKLIEYGAY